MATGPFAEIVGKVAFFVLFMSDSCDGFSHHDNLHVDFVINAQRTA